MAGPDLRRNPLELDTGADGIAVGESAHGPGFDMADRADPYHKLVFVQRGRLRLRALDGPDTALAAGALVAVPARRRHRFEDQEPATLLLLAVAPARLRPLDRSGLWADLVARPRRAPDPATRDELERLWRRLIAEQAGDRRARAAALAADALRVLVLAARAPESDATEGTAARVAAVAELVRERCYEAWSLDRAATLAGCSRRRFSQLFRCEVGTSFVPALTRARVDHATDLLASGRHSILGACFASGFQDLAHFYRCFRRVHGTSPGRWRAVGS